VNADAADLSIRPLTPDLDWDEYADLSARAFGPADPARVRAITEPLVVAGRGLGAFDGGRLIGTALYHDMRQWWAGRAVPMAGVAGVKVAPEYRGRGAGRALMTALTELMTGRGYPLAVLYPATMIIYRSLGWEIAGHRYEAVLPAKALLSLPRPAPQAIKELRRPGPGDAAEVIGVLGRAHGLARDCGPITYDEPTVGRWLADTHTYAYLAPDGFVEYHWHHGNDEMYVHRLVAASAETTAALWAVVASHSSVADRVRVQVGPADPFWWLLREEEADLVGRDGWMLRLLDAPAAIAARGFPAVDIAVPLVITDDLCPVNSGRWELTVGAGAGSLSRLRASPGDADAARPEALAVGARGLAALYAGTPVATLRRAGLAEGGSAHDDAALDAAFAAAPYMLDDF
jgi:predicted acetyltransferase